MSRISKKPAPAQPARIEPVSDDVIDHWIKVRCQRAHSVVGYTPATTLVADFTKWHEAEYPDVAVPSEAAFIEALNGAYRIKFEKMPVTEIGRGERMALSVSLTLNPPLRAAA